MTSSRSPWSAAITLALLVTPVAGFLLLRPDAVKPPSRANQSAFLVARPAASASQGAPRVLARSQLAASRSIARRFAAQYSGYIAGRLTARGLGDAAADLVRELRRYPARITPAQQRYRPTVRHIAVEPVAATVRAVATLQAAGAPPFELSFVLERRGSRWLVTRLLDA